MPPKGKVDLLEALFRQFKMAYFHKSCPVRKYMVSHLLRYQLTPLTRFEYMTEAGENIKLTLKSQDVRLSWLYLNPPLLTLNQYST